MISNPREWQICLQQRVTLERRGTNRHTGGRALPNMGWLLLWGTWKLMVNKEIRFASQRVWRMWQCLDCQSGAVQGLWPELCPAPEVREEQLGGQDQAWNLQGPWSMPFLEEMKPVTSLWCSNTEPSEPGPSWQPFPLPLQHLEETLNTTGSVKVVQRHRKKIP